MDRGRFSPFGCGRWAIRLICQLNAVHVSLQWVHLMVCGVCGAAGARGSGAMWLHLRESWAFGVSLAASNGADGCKLLLRQATLAKHPKMVDFLVRLLELIFCESNSSRFGHALQGSPGLLGSEEFVETREADLAEPMPICVSQDFGPQVKQMHAWQSPTPTPRGGLVLVPCRSSHIMVSRCL